MLTLQLAWLSVRHASFSVLVNILLTFPFISVLLEGPEKLVPGYVPSYYTAKNKPA
jgi:hypothetical protein